ncbi:unnamed protein product [Thelazia callipaeda]|uniref:Hist_deacetyl domain-containing protein n=1 Tax=Thelazia callipaeda TaxID=103827 RepID=A0A0N5D6D0_THECL|nr:unnamed protein product [Thelazia callipaeda]
MLLHRCEWDDYHVEHPGRLSAVLQKLENSDLLHRCICLQAKEADLEDVALVHSRHYIEQFASTEHMTLEELEKFASTFDDIYLNNHSYRAALISAGVSLLTLEAVLSTNTRNSASFAAVRPPGHHASFEKACGFCIFNNVAICAKKARTLGVEKVLIIDWDVHAGQGTQYAIADDPNIKLISIHRYEHGLFWPHLCENDNTINVPLNGTGFGDSEYVSFIQHLVVPVIFDFLPNLILISAGFDAAYGDEEGNMNLTPAGYYWMTKLVVDAAAAISAPLCMLMEGGYFADSLAYGVQFCMEALLDNDGPEIQLGFCSPGFLYSLHNSILHHAHEFPNLQLLADVTRSIRILYSVSPIKVCSLDFNLLFFKALDDECQFCKISKDQCEVYATRGLYSPQEESLSQNCQHQLQQIVENYTYTSKTEPMLPLVFVKKISENRQLEPEIQMEMDDSHYKIIINFMQLHVGTYFV